MFPCFRKCQHTIPRIFLFDGCEADTSQHSPRKSYVPSWVLKCIKQTDSPLVWSLTSEFYPSGTPIPPIFHGFDITFSAMCCCAKCTKAHNAQSMLRTEGMALRSWRSWRQLFLAVLGGFRENNDLNFVCLARFFAYRACQIYHPKMPRLGRCCFFCSGYSTTHSFHSKHAVSCQRC